jgi:hypothetical protein
MRRVEYLYCMEHELPLVPPDASHLNRPDLDGGCVAVSLIGPAYLGIDEDARDLAEYFGDCDHWDHHGYCQTHGLGEAVTTNPTRCSIGRLRASLLEVAVEGEGK